MENTSPAFEEARAQYQGAPREYAGFWLRLGAVIIDGLIIGLVMSLIGGVFGGMFAVSLSDASDDTMAAIFGGGLAVLYMVGSIAGLLYFALMEASEKQATLGKMALGIKVTTMEGNRLTFLNALGRNLGKIISGAILYIGYIMAGFTEKKQALHDMMANALVVKK